MKNHNILIVLLAGIITVTGCSPKYYVPNTQNVPLLTRKGEINLSACGNTNQLEIQGAYALTKRLGLVANGGFFIPQDENNGNGGRGNLVEAGAGYYLPLANHLVFEAYGLAGYGTVENHMPSTLNDNPNTTGKIDAGILRFAIQPNIGFKSKYFSAAISSRIVSLNYNNIKGSLIYNNVNQVTYLNENNSLFVAEPAITLRGGIEKLKVQVQLAGSYNLSKSDFLQEKSLLSIGLNLNL